MNAEVRQIEQGLQYQGEDESIIYTLTTTSWGNDPSSPSAKIFTYISDTYNDVTSAIMTGSATVSGNVITLPAIASLVDGTMYRVEVQFILSGSTFEAYAWISGQR
jgi:hypothetical protein